ARSQRHRREADGAAVDGPGRDGHGGSFENARYRCGDGGRGYRRGRERGRARNRRRHQPDDRPRRGGRNPWRELAAGRGLRPTGIGGRGRRAPGGGRRGRSAHAGAGRSRSADDRHAPEEYGGGGARQDGPLASRTTVLQAALTGGIATGKSYCLNRFGTLGVPTIDADPLARLAVAPGSPGLQAVRHRFGTQMVRADGSLDRAALARIVFSDRAAPADLEAIVHPDVYRRIREWFAQLPFGTPVAIADIPLLFETGHAHDFDAVVVAA